MKFTAILLLAAALQVCAKGHSQNITISVKNVSLDKVFKEIKAQTSYTFFYTDDQLQNAKKVTLQISNASIEQVLELCFKDQPYSYQIIDRMIVVKPKNASTIPKEVNPNETFLTTIDVSGKVTDTEGKPLEGATVAVKGTKNITRTDAGGVFILKGIDEDASLEISYAEYETVIVKVSKRSSISISLKREIGKLGEIIINKGYYTEKQKYSVGNVTHIDAKDIEKQPVQNVLLALQGRVPGLEITQLTGMNGGGVQARIQGQNSIQGGLDPLVVIDGVPFATQMFGNMFESVVRGGSPLNYINPADIESIDILKDADATAIYGSRAANGAILITTKKGKAGLLKLTINFQKGWGKASRLADMMNTRQYLDMRYEAFKNDGRIPSSNPNATAPFMYAPDLTIWDTTRYTNWQKVLLGGTAEYTNIGASISGGTSIVQYLIGATYNRQSTIFPGNFDDKAAGLHFNINGGSANQRLRISLSGSYLHDRNRISGSDRAQLAAQLEPNAPNLYNADGTLNWAPNAAGTSTWDNPLAFFLHTDFSSTSKNLVSNLNLSYKILQGLEMSTNVGYTNLHGDVYKPIRIEFYKPERRPNNQRSAGFGNRNMNSWIIEPQLRYSTDVGKGKLEAIAGASMQQSKNSMISLLGVGYSSDLLMKTILTAPQIQLDGANDNSYKYAAVFGRLNYVWEKKYILNLTGRRDGSSRFGDKNKFHNFGSIGTGWIISDEKWIQKNLTFLSFAKLRTSYGITGNDQIRDYSYLTTFEPVFTPVAYQNSSSLAVGYNAPNPHLQWEETKKWQGGLDLGFLKDRLIVGITYARNRSSNQLINYVLPSFTGYDIMMQNFPATIQNTSWEFTLNTTNVKSRNFTWTTSFNITIPNNKLVSFPNIEFTSYKNPDFGVAVGHPLGFKYLYRYAGVDPATGKYMVFDKNGNPTTTPDFGADRTVYVGRFARYYGGVTNALSYKGVQLDFLLQFVRRKGPLDMYFDNTTNTPGRFSAGVSNQPITVLDRWQKPGDNVDFARYSVNQIGTYPRGSDVYYNYDASYMRLKNLSLSWQLPNSVLKRAHIQNARLYFRGQNLITITNYAGDPETGANTVPPLKIYTVGAQMEF